MLYLSSSETELVPNTPDGHGDIEEEYDILEEHENQPDNRY